VTPLVGAIAFALVCAGAFAVGLKFYRTAEDREGVSVAQAQRFGRLLMMAATAMILFLVAVIVRGDFRVTA
jgi:uncharacterized membrane protein SpoIIM required for sporulation